MSSRQDWRSVDDDSDKLPILGDDGRESAGGYYNNNHVRNKAPGSRAFPSNNRPGSGSRRTPTPTKQVALQAVRRKDESVKEPFDDVDLAELSSKLKLESEKSLLERENSNTNIKKKESASGFTVKLPNPEGARPKESSSTHTKANTCSETKDVDKSRPNLKAQDKQDIKRGSKAEESSDDDDDDDDDEDWEDGVKQKAPMQLMMEFIGCLMEGDYPNAAKLCKMILMYEPDNTEALKFQPLIDEKIELDAQPDADTESGESGTEEEEDEGNSDDDSDDSDSDDSDSDESESSSESEADNEEGAKADSGISSGLSNSNSNSEME